MHSQSATTHLRVCAQQLEIIVILPHVALQAARHLVLPRHVLLVRAGHPVGVRPQLALQPLQPLVQLPVVVLNRLLHSDVIVDNEDLLQGQQQQAENGAAGSRADQPPVARVAAAAGGDHRRSPLAAPLSRLLTSISASAGVRRGGRTVSERGELGGDAVQQGDAARAATGMPRRPRAPPLLAQHLADHCWAQGGRRLPQPRLWQRGAPLSGSTYSVPFSSPAGSPAMDASAAAAPVPRAQGQGSAHQLPAVGTRCALFSGPTTQGLPSNNCQQPCCVKAGAGDDGMR